MALAPQLVNKLRMPIVAAPMFLVSGPELIIAACREGIIGSFPALNQRQTKGYEDWLIQIRDGLQQAEQEGQRSAPYAVNLIVHHSNSRLPVDLEMTVKYQVPLVITSLGIDRSVVDAVHSYGGLVFHDVVNMRFAEKALDAGVDGLIAVCAGAGGHAGTYNPFAFITELRALTDKTILASGAISNGASILAAQACGADLAYLGTRFIVAKESLAKEHYQQMLLDSSAKDIVYTPKISGVPANFLQASIEAAGLDLNRSTTPRMNMGEKLDSDAKAWVDILSAGQGVGGITQIDSVAQICSQLSKEYDAALARLNVNRALFR
jgi:nitronate monooxygenase